MVKYDKDYQEKDLFGKPYEGLISFFKQHRQKVTLLDLGCGQGRDSIPLAKMGYSVTGVDISKVGINQMLEQSKGLKLKGVVDDIYSFDVKGYDIILLDSMFHFEKNDLDKETSFLKRIFTDMKIKGVLCILVWKSKRIEKELMNVFDSSSQKWNVLKDTYVDYPEQNMKYRMLAIEKIS